MTKREIRNEKNFMFPKTESMFASNENTANCQCLQPIKIILVTTSKEKRYLVSLKPRKAKAQEKTSSHSEAPKFRSNETSLLKEKCISDKKLTPRMSLFDKATQKSNTSLSGCETEEYSRKLKQPVTNVIRLAGGWGCERLNCIKRRKKNKQKSKTTNKKGHNKYEKDEEASETLASESVLKNSSHRVKKIRHEDILQAEAKLYENRPIKKDMPLTSGICKHTTVLDEIYQNEQQSTTKEPLTTAPTGFVTSSFVQNLIEETCPVLCTERETDNLVPICGASEAVRSRDTQPDAQLLSDIFYAFPPDEEIRKRISILEEQVCRINFELKNLQRIAMPTNDGENFSGLTKILSEINIQLVELRDNISKLQTEELQMQQSTEINDAIELIFQNFPPGAINWPPGGCECRNFGRQNFSQTCNYEVYEKPQMSAVSAKNCSCMCNCLNYSQELEEGSQQTKSLLQRNEMPINADTSPSTHREHEHSLYLTHQAFPNNSAKAKARTIQESSEYPSTTATVNEHLITPSSRDYTNNFTDGFATDSSLPETISSSYGELPLTTQNISKALRKIIGDIESDKVALSVYLESNNLYFINVSHIQTGQCLGYIYTNEAAFTRAKEEKLFDKFLVFSVLNSKVSLPKSNQVLSNTFEFVLN